MLLLLLLVQDLNLVALAWFHKTTVLRLAVLRQQLAVYKRRAQKPRFNNRDRLFWFVISRAWKDWHSELILVLELARGEYLERQHNILLMGNPESHTMETAGLGQSM